MRRPTAIHGGNVGGGVGGDDGASPHLPRDFSLGGGGGRFSRGGSVSPQTFFSTILMILSVWFRSALQAVMRHRVCLQKYCLGGLALFSCIILVGFVRLHCFGEHCAVRFEDGIALEPFDRENVEAWLDVLGEGEIVSARWMLNSVSTKFEVLLHHRGSYYRAVAKVFGGEYPWSFPIGWARTISSSAIIDEGGAPPSLSDTTFGRWTDNGRDQGVGELLSFHASHALGLSARPPMVARVLDSSSLFVFHDGWTSVIPSAYAVYIRFIRILSPPLYVIRAFWPVRFHLNAVLMPWMSLEEHHPPSDAVAALMASPHLPTHTAADELEQAYAASDILVLDYIMDDDDRQWTKNWVWDTNERWVHWDNGLAFQRGPLRTGNPLVLCVKFALNKYEQHQPRSSCPKLCLFRPSTIVSLMRSRKSFGSAVLDSVRSQVDDSVWNQNLYINREDSTSPMVWPTKFPPIAYAQGLDQRIDDLLEHIEQCRAQR